MTIKDITEKEKEEFNQIVNHPLQSYEWGEFREKTGVKVIRRGFFENGKIIDGFQLTIHKVPKTTFTIGYLPKGNLPTKEVLSELEKIGRENKCIFIQLEPNVQKYQMSNIQFPISNLKPSFHPLFTKYTFVLDLTKSEEELLKSFHPKTRYNIKIAQKYNVQVAEDNSKEAFEEYLKLSDETTKRQKFYAHTPSYHKKLWETIGGQMTDDRRQTPEDKRQNKNKLTAHLLTATYSPSSVSSAIRPPSSVFCPLTLASWILFVFKDTLYYPYGASSSLYKETMASNLIMWEAINFGKKIGLKKFDMWGALGPNPDEKDPWFGFHRFKKGYGAELTEFIGSFDFVLNSNLYNLYKIADKLRWSILKIKKMILQ